MICGPQCLRRTLCRPSRISPKRSEDPTLDFLIVRIEFSDDVGSRPLRIGVMCFTDVLRPGVAKHFAEMLVDSAADLFALISVCEDDVIFSFTERALKTELSNLGSSLEMIYGTSQNVVYSLPPQLRGAGSSSSGVPDPLPILKRANFRSLPRVLAIYAGKPYRAVGADAAKKQRRAERES